MIISCLPEEAHVERLMDTPIVLDVWQLQYPHHDNEPHEGQVVVCVSPVGKDPTMRGR